MRKIVFFAILFLFAGCADKTAFSKFHLTKEQEIAVDNIEFGKFVKDSEIFGVVMGVDLKRIYPKRYKNYDAFYIVIAPKRGELLKQIEFKLNDNPLKALKKLKSSNEFSDLIQIKNRWTHYYEVIFFQKNSSKNLEITLSNGAKATLSFQKNQ